MSKIEDANILKSNQLVYLLQNIHGLISSGVVNTQQVEQLQEAAAAITAAIKQELVGDEA